MLKSSKSPDDKNLTESRNIVANEKTDRNSSPLRKIMKEEIKLKKPQILSKKVATISFGKDLKLDNSSAVFNRAQYLKGKTSIHFETIGFEVESKDGPGNKVSKHFSDFSPKRKKCFSNGFQHQSLSQLLNTGKDKGYNSNNEGKIETDSVATKKNKRILFGVDEAVITVSKSANIMETKERKNMFGGRKSIESHFLKKSIKPFFVKKLEKETKIIKDQKSHKNSRVIFQDESDFPKELPKIESSKLPCYPKDSQSLFKTIFSKNEIKKPQKKNLFDLKKGILTQSKNFSGTLTRNALLFNQNSRLENLQTVLKTSNLQLIFKHEEFLYNFLVAFNNQSDIHSLFNQYIDWIEENNFQPFLDLIAKSRPVNAIKIAFICERMSLLVIFYLYTKGLYRTEIIFIKKTMMHVYMNFREFYKTIGTILKEMGEMKLLPKLTVRNFASINFEMLPMSVEKNNIKILKILEVEIQSEEKEIFDSFHKLKQLMDDFSLNESWTYFKTTFVTLVV